MGASRSSMRLEKQNRGHLYDDIKYDGVVESSAPFVPIGMAGGASAHFEPKSLSDAGRIRLRAS